MKYKTKIDRTGLIQFLHTYWEFLRIALAHKLAHKGIEKKKEASTQGIFVRGLPLPQAAGVHKARPGQASPAVHSRLGQASPEPLSARCDNNSRCCCNPSHLRKLRTPQRLVGPSLPPCARCTGLLQALRRRAPPGTPTYWSALPAVVQCETEHPSPNLLFVFGSE